MFHRIYAHYIDKHAGQNMSLLEILTRMMNTKTYMIASTLF